MFQVELINSAPVPPFYELLFEQTMLTNREAFYKALGILPVHRVPEQWRDEAMPVAREKLRAALLNFELRLSDDQLDAVILNPQHLHAHLAPEPTTVSDRLSLPLMHIIRNRIRRLNRLGPILGKMLNKARPLFPEGLMLVLLRHASEHTDSLEHMEEFVALLLPYCQPEDLSNADGDRLVDLLASLGLGEAVNHLLCSPEDWYQPNAQGIPLLACVLQSEKLSPPVIRLMHTKVQEASNACLIRWHDILLPALFHHGACSTAYALIQRLPEAQLETVPLHEAFVRGRVAVNSPEDAQAFVNMMARMTYSHREALRVQYPHEYQVYLYTSLLLQDDDTQEQKYEFLSDLKILFEQFYPNLTVQKPFHEQPPIEQVDSLLEIFSGLSHATTQRTVNASLLILTRLSPFDAQYAPQKLVEACFSRAVQLADLRLLTAIIDKFGAERFFTSRTSLADALSAIYLAQPVAHAQKARTLIPLTSVLERVPTQVFEKNRQVRNQMMRLACENGDVQMAGLLLKKAQPTQDPEGPYFFEVMIGALYARLQDCCIDDYPEGTLEILETLMKGMPPHLLAENPDDDEPSLALGIASHADITMLSFLHRHHVSMWDTLDGDCPLSTLFYCVSEELKKMPDQATKEVLLKKLRAFTVSLMQIETDQDGNRIFHPAISVMFAEQNPIIISELLEHAAVIGDKALLSILLNPLFNAAPRFRHQALQTATLCLAEQGKIALAIELLMTPALLWKASSGEQALSDNFIDKLVDCINLTAPHTLPLLCRTFPVFFGGPEFQNRLPPALWEELSLYRAGHLQEVAAFVPGYEASTAAPASSAQSRHQGTTLVTGGGLPARLA